MLGIAKELKTGISITEGYEKKDSAHTYKKNYLDKVEQASTELINITSNYLTSKGIDPAYKADEITSLNDRMYRTDKFMYSKFNVLFDDIGKSLSARFNFDITVVFKNNGNPVNSTRLNLSRDYVLYAKDSLSKDLDLDKNVTMGKDSNSRRKAVYKTMTALNKAFKNNKLSIDENKLVVNGLEEGNIVINLNPVGIFTSGFTAKELTSRIVAEVVSYIVYIKYINNTHNKNNSILETLKKTTQKYNSLDKSIRVMVSKDTPTDVRDNASLASLIRILLSDSFKSKEDIEDEVHKETISYLVKLNLSAPYTSALVKEATYNRKINFEVETVDDITLKYILTVVGIYLLIILTAMLILGLTYIGIAIAVFIALKDIVVFGVFIKFTEKLFGSNGIIAKINNLKIEKKAIIRELRDINVTADEINIYIGNLNLVKAELAIYEDMYAYSELVKSKGNTVDEMSDSLSNNDIHGIAASINVLDKLKIN